MLRLVEDVPAGTPTKKIRFACPSLPSIETTPMEFFVECGPAPPKPGPEVDVEIELEETLLTWEELTK